MRQRVNILQYLPKTIRTSKPMPITCCAHSYRELGDERFLIKFMFLISLFLVRASLCRHLFAHCVRHIFLHYTDLPYACHCNCYVPTNVPSRYTHDAVLYVLCRLYQMLLRVQISCFLTLWKSKQVGERECYKESQRCFDLGQAQ